VPVVDEFDSSLLNTFKTKDMLIDLRRKQPGSPLPTYINRISIEVVEQYKYLGIVIDSNLKFDINTEIICKKGQ